MAWHQSNDYPLSEPMVALFTDAYRLVLNEPNHKYFGIMENEKSYMQLHVHGPFIHICLHCQIMYLIPYRNIIMLRLVYFSRISQIAKFMGPTWVLSASDGPHVGPMNLVIRDHFTCSFWVSFLPLRYHDTFVDNTNKHPVWQRRDNVTNLELSYIRFIGPCDYDREDYNPNVIVVS